MTYSLIGKYAESLLANDTKGPNYEIYQKRLTKTPNPTPGFEYTPYCIYFYYVRIDNSGKIRVDHYLYPSTPPNQWTPILHADVPDHMYDLAINARPRTPLPNKDPQPHHTVNFDAMPWTRRSYIAIFVDEANWRFVKLANGKPSVVFNPDEGEANHTFFDAADCVIDMPIWNTTLFDKRSGIYFVNHMKGRDGFDLGDEPESFKFNMNFTAEYANSSTTGALINFDPGGTNQGPPETP